MKLKKKLTKDEVDVLLNDLESLEIEKTTNNLYYYNLLRGNILDLGGIKNEKDNKDKKENP